MAGKLTKEYIESLRASLWEKLNAQERDRLEKLLTNWEHVPDKMFGEVAKFIASIEGR